MRFHAATFIRWRHLWTPEFLALLLALFVFVAPTSASTRLEDRSLFTQSNEPGSVTSYTVAFRYMTPVPISSVDLLFCISPIPYEACVTPPGLDASNAVLSDQTGETGYSIASKSANHIVLSRPSSGFTASLPSSYKFDNVKNPADGNQSFSIRLRTHSSLDASGPQVDFGSVKGQVQRGINIETQVPPMLMFCVAQQVDEDCSTTNETYYTNMGLMDTASTLVAKSQMSVGTNASGGFAIISVGTPLAAGTSVIKNMATPTVSTPGKDQFGINLVANTAPAIGNDPEGVWTNAAPTADYGTPDQYKYMSGDVIAESPNVSLMKKFTISYIVNASPGLRAGVYSTTITYIATGRF